MPLPSRGLVLGCTEEDVCREIVLRSNAKYLFDRSSNHFYDICKLCTRLRRQYLRNSAKIVKSVTTCSWLVLVRHVVFCAFLSNRTMNRFRTNFGENVSEIHRSFRIARMVRTDREELAILLYLVRLAKYLLESPIFILWGGATGSRFN